MTELDDDAEEDVDKDAVDDDSTDILFSGVIGDEGGFVLANCLGLQV